MTPAHPQPFDLIFGVFRESRFPAIRAALDGRDDIESFVLAGPALELLRELRPDEGLGDGVDDFVALVHAAYLYWRDRERLVTLDEAATRALARRERSEGSLSVGERSFAPIGNAPFVTRYVQVAPRIIWSQLDPESAFEPLDGWFAISSAPETLRMVACFGVHPERPGVSVVAVAGPRQAATLRADGSAPFSPTMPGGDAAHLFAVQTPAELLLLGWRAMQIEEVS